MPNLSAKATIKVRFSEVDSLKIVWHGHYLKYFEEGREAFGAKYGIGYQDIFDQGLLTPLVKINCEYKKPLVYGDHAIIETTYISTESAKICFEYEIRSQNSGEIVATGTSMQVFLNHQMELLLVAPDTYTEWKRKWNIPDMNTF